MIRPDFAGFNPYIFKAYYDYIVDHDDIPHLLINPQVKGVELPRQFAARSELVLSISPNAARNFTIGADGLSFGASFSGQGYEVYLPYACIHELIATESKIAIPIRMFFVPDEPEAEPVEDNDGAGDGPGFEIMDGDDEPKALEGLAGSELGLNLDNLEEQAGEPEPLPEPVQKEKKSEEKKQDDDPDFTILT